MPDNRGPVYREGDKWIFRASQFGHCINQLLYHGRGYDPVPFPDGIKQAMQEGNEWEPKIIQYLRRKEIQGDPLTMWSIYANQREYDLELLPNLVIRVHIDGIGRKFSSSPVPIIQTDFPYVHEYKAFGPDLTSIFTKSGLENLPAYRYQLSIEMLATGLPGLFFVLDKEHSTPTTQHIIWRLYETPPIPKVQIVKRLLLLNRLLESGDKIPCEAESDGFFCPYYKFHANDRPTSVRVFPVGKLDPVQENEVRRHRQLSSDILVLRKESDHIRDNILKKLCDEDTDYTVDDRTFGFYSSYRDEWDMAGLLDMARSKGIDVEQFHSRKKVVSIRNGKSQPK